MGNVAVINVQGDTTARGTYVHWYGGRGSIAGFLRETKIRLGRDYIYRENNPADDIEADIATFYAAFYSAAREFFNYDGRFKRRHAEHIYMEGRDVSRGMGGNGCFTIQNDFTCKRIDMENMSEYDATTYDRVGEFFELSHAALCAVRAAETDEYRTVPFTAAELLEQIERAKNNQANATARIARLEEKLAAANSPQATSESPLIRAIWAQQQNAMA